MPPQQKVLEDWWHSNFGILTASRGFGKAQPLDSKLLTPSGFIEMREVRIGTNLLTPEGDIQEVISIHHQGEIETYEVVFSDGRIVECCENHLWKVKGLEGDPQIYGIRKTSEIMGFLETKSEVRHVSVRAPLVEDVFTQKEDVDLPIHPYLLGSLIGDGNLTHYVGFSSQDEFILRKVEKLAGDALTLKRRSKYDYVFIGTVKGKNPLKKYLHELGLFRKKSYEKSIPEKYLNLSRKQTLELLQGLLDTDGTVSNGGSVTFSSTSEILAKQVQSLIWKLGGICKLSSRVTSYPNNLGEKVKGRVSYRLTVRMKDKTKLFSLPRKLERLKKKDQYSENLSLSIKEIRLKRRTECQCITVSGPEGLYVTDDYVVTHNTFVSGVFIALKAMLYPGIKIGIIAPTFRQAQLTFDEFRQFVDDSPLLAAEIDKYPTKQTDKCLCVFKTAKGHRASQIIALPLGNDGKKIRGNRFNCLTGNTLVVTEDGIEEIASCVEKSNSSKVYSRKGKHTPKYYLTQSPKKIAQIRTSLGYKISGSFDHPILTIGKSSNLEEMKHLGKISGLDRVVVSLEDIIPKEFKSSITDRDLQDDITSLSELPKWILKSSRKELLLFLGRLFTSPNFSNQFRSEKMSEQIQIILSYFGILSLRYNSDCRKESWVVDINLEPYRELFQRKVSDPDCREIVSNYFLDSVSKTEILSDAPVYDFSFDTEHHEFISNSFTSHNCVMIDECVHVPQNVFQAAIRPMLSTTLDPVESVEMWEKIEAGEIDITEADGATSNGYFAYTSAYYKFNYWWSEIELYAQEIAKARAEGKKSSYCLHFVPWYHMPKGFFQEHIIKNSQASDPEHVFLTEWCARWIDDSAGAFKMSMLKRCQDPSCIPYDMGRPNKEYIAGIDPARNNDSSALAIIEVGHPCKLVHLQELIDVPWPEQAKRIMNCLKRFNIKAIYMDMFGGGQTLADSWATPEFCHPLGVKPIVEKDMAPGNAAGARRILYPIKPSSGTNEDINDAALKVLEERWVVLPPSGGEVEVPKSGQVDADGNPIVSYRSYEIIGTRKTNVKDSEGNSRSKKINLVDELIKQMAAVVVTETKSGRLHYGLPKNKGSAGSEALDSLEDYKKDLYSAFILAAKGVYDLEFVPKYDIVQLATGFVRQVKDKKDDIPHRGLISGATNNTSTKVDNTGLISRQKTKSGGEMTTFQWGIVVGKGDGRRR